LQPWKRVNRLKYHLHHIQQHSALITYPFLLSSIFFISELCLSLSELTSALEDSNSASLHITSIFIWTNNFTTRCSSSSPTERSSATL
jgi:hypothetical protein